VLTAGGRVSLPELGEYCVVGELALDGSVRPVKGVLPVALLLAGTGKKLIVPTANADEAGVAEGVAVFPVGSLSECVDFLQKKRRILPHRMDVQELLASRSKYPVDFSEIKGQGAAKRAMEVAVAGGHNILMIGSPGGGKSMLASRVPTILPRLSLDEALEITRIHSVAGLAGGSLVTTRPFRSPHHTVSDVALIGGGNIPRPGEVSLAHHGVLFLDELPEFNRDALESLRQPLEDGQVSVSRARGRITFPARFMLVAAMNPCPCGWYGDRSHACHCTVAQILKYRRRISGPLLDRIDIHIEVTSLPAPVLFRERAEESSAAVRERVEHARQVQRNRFAGDGGHCNGHMTPAQVREWCVLSGEAKSLLESALTTMHLSARAYDRIRKVARTIADLDGSAAIGVSHIAEAVQYRSLDREDW